MVIVTEDDRYRYANVNLARRVVAPPPGPDSGFFARYDAAYAPLAVAKWIVVDRYGPDPGSRALAARLFADPRLGFFRWFAEFPALYRIDRGNRATCGWFEDLRFDIPGRETNLFRFGLCDEDGGGEWKAFRLLGDGRREAAD